MLDQFHNQARTAALGAWVADEGAKVAVSASNPQGTRREGAAGRAGTRLSDLLNSEADLVLAEARLIGAQRDGVIASYTPLSAVVQA